MYGIACEESMAVSSEAPILVKEGWGEKLFMCCCQGCQATASLGDLVHRFVFSTFEKHWSLSYVSMIDIRTTFYSHLAFQSLIFLVWKEEDWPNLHFGFQKTHLKINFLTTLWSHCCELLLVLILVPLLIIALKAAPYGTIILGHCLHIFVYSVWERQKHWWFYFIIFYN